MRDPAAFWDRAARKYAASPISDEETYRKKLAMTRAYLRPDAEALELGCGTGSTAILHAPHLRSLLATDCSEKMLVFARDRAREAGVSNISFQCASVETLELGERRFDIVLALNLLHLVEDWRGALRKAHGLLKPGAVFVSGTACIGDFMPWIRIVAPLGRAVGLLPMVSVFTLEALKAELLAAGFSIEEIWSPGPRKADFIIARKAA